MIAPDTQCAEIPRQPLDGQATSASGCPRGYSAINGGCWLEAKEQPPCPVHTYERDGRCYAPLMLTGRKPTIPITQEP